MLGGPVLSEYPLLFRLGTMILKGGQVGNNETVDLLRYTAEYC